MFEHDLPNIIGLIGVGMVLIAYFLLQLHKINPKAVLFSVINLVGAILILISLMFHWNLASVVIEISWISISLFGLYWSLKRRAVNS